MKKVYAIKVTVDEQEFLNLKLLLSKYGGTAPAYFRDLLRDAFRKEQGGYKARGNSRIRSVEKKVKKQVEEEEKTQVTVEQYCELKGGKLERENGIMKCMFQTTPPTRFNPEGNWRGIPLTKKDIDNYVNE